MNYENAKERYQNDPLFRRMVEVFYQLFRENKTTIGEARDALMFAGIKFEQEHVRPIIIKNGEAKFA